MAVDLTNTLIVAISATALFDLTESENHLLQLLQQRPYLANHNESQHRPNNNINN